MCNVDSNEATIDSSACCLFWYCGCIDHCGLQGTLAGLQTDSAAAACFTWLTGWVFVWMRLYKVETRTHAHTNTYEHTHTQLTNLLPSTVQVWFLSPSLSACQLLGLEMRPVGDIDRSSIITHTLQHVHQRLSKVTETDVNPEYFLFLLTSTVSSCIFHTGQFMFRL